MDDVLAEALEILDSDSVRTSEKIIQKSRSAAESKILKHKIHKNLAKKKREERKSAKVKFGLNQKYKSNEKVAEIYKRGTKTEKTAHRERVLRGLKRTAVDTELTRWCKLSGSRYIEESEKNEEENEESAFDDAYFEKFEKEYLGNNQK